MSLWLPIILSAVFVFIASSLIHMVLKYHNKDFKKLPNEEKIMEAMRPFAPPPGDYMMPHGGGMEAMKDPAFVDKLTKGPVAIMTVLPSGRFSMKKSLSLWFIYTVVVSIFAAYVAGRALPPGSPYLAVHRFAGVAAFLGYTLALWQDSIWHGRSWGSTARITLDGLIYGFVTGGTFGWLWPR